MFWRASVDMTGGCRRWLGVNRALVGRRIMVQALSRSMLVALVACLATSGAAHGQSRFSLGASAGLASGASGPFGSQAIGYQTEFNLEYQTPLSALRLRSQLVRADWGAGGVTGITGSFVVAPFVVRQVRPYLVAGAGLYMSGGRASARRSALERRSRLVLVRCISRQACIIARPTRTGPPTVFQSSVALPVRRRSTTVAAMCGCRWCSGSDSRSQIPDWRAAK